MTLTFIGGHLGPLVHRVRRSDEMNYTDDGPQFLTLHQLTLERKLLSQP